MEWTITVHIDEMDKEFLETLESKRQIEFVVARCIMDLKQNYWERQSRPQGTGSFRGTDK